IEKERLEEFRIEKESLEELRIEKKRLEEQKDEEIRELKAQLQKKKEEEEVQFSKEEFPPLGNIHVAKPCVETEIHYFGNATASPKADLSFVLYGCLWSSYSSERYMGTVELPPLSKELLLLIPSFLLCILQNKG
ncbi:hypothetical protein Tco_1441134, partial [Tanacetum coccineum]